MNEIATKLKTMKGSLGLSNKELSDLSGVPIGTVNRVMAGRVEAPNFQTIRDLVKAMGGSLDEIAGSAPAAGEAPPEPEAAQAAGKPEQSEPSQPGMPPEAVRAYGVLLQEKQKEIDTKDRWLKRLFGVCCALMGIIIAVLVFDLLNPTMGFFLR